MFKRLTRLVYRVTDIDRGRQWYRALLGIDPVFDTPFAVVFSFDGSELVLSPYAGPMLKNESGPITYWGVDDVESAYKRLLQLGAMPHSEINTLSGVRRASVYDPDGNIIGLIGTEADNTRASVEHRPSESALAVAFMRALATLDDREQIRGRDHLSETFLTEERKKALQNPAVRDWMRKNPPGLYEYVIARTAFFDHIVEKALKEKVPQIVFLGAGYDSRSYRFRDLISETRIFEVDALPTQQRKRELLQTAGVSIPGQLTFVPVNFTTDDLEEVLLKAGLDRDKKTLFIWEGVTFYLPQKAVDHTLDVIRRNSKKGSAVCFDCSLSSKDGMNGYGVKELREAMKTSFPGEATVFAVESGKIETFLSDRGLSLVEHVTTEDMERKYLTLPDGSPAGRVTAMFSFVHAST